MNNTPKWIPKHSSDIAKLFQRSKDLECEFRLLAKRFSTDINLDLLDFYEFKILIEECRKCLTFSEDVHLNLRSQISSSASKKLQRSPYKVLLQQKASLMADNLSRRIYQLIFVINKTIKSLLDMAPFSEIIVEAALSLCNLYNESVELTLKQERNSTGAKVISNTFPSLLLQPKKIEIGAILQIVSKNRSEQCCGSLISSLLATCKLELTPGDNESETSSVEILRTLTSHLTSPTENFAYQRTQSNAELMKPEMTTILPNECDDPTIKFFDDMANGLFDKLSIDEKALIRDEILERLITDEENFIASIIVKCFKICPSAFETISNTQDFQKWVNRGSRSLWTQIGSTLDHVVLWWSDAPLACRPAICTRQLRDWLLLLQFEDAPEPILSTLKGLGETLTTHVTMTIWDQQFRLALVASSLHSDSSLKIADCSIELEVPGTITGGLWVEVLSTLINLCNSCDQNGTIPNQLPIVEQIPIIHRLDHSIHTMRLWSTAKAKTLCSEWNMSTFFKVVHNDIRNCLEQLMDLRAPELVPADLLEVLIQVCVSLRSKLISEVKANILKLKDTSNECIDILASICRTYSLAQLTLCFPAAKFWQTEVSQDCANQYVSYFLKQVYFPILSATKDIEILNLTLKIICEAWLDHIYLKRVKFSRCGAVNLLKDFDGVADWILSCPAVPSEYVEKLSKHEVLRMCEGVGRILLRKPEEIVSMLPSPKFKRKDDDEPDDKTKLPPEMFVPNQKRWLELRARSSRKTINCLCLCNGAKVLN